MTIGHKLGLRLFLEGVEVPVIGASITVAANMPATCALQVIATDKILEILPRTLAHLFFYDFVGKESAAETTMQEDIDNSAYKILFIGEVQGLAFQKGASNRSVILNCVDLSNYWDTTYQYNFKGSLLGGRKHAAFIGANANYFNGPLGHGVGTIAALLNGRSVNYPELKGLLAGIVRVLETIGGAYYGDTTFKGANDFSSIAELRLKVLQQITAAEKDDSTAKLFARKTFNRWLNRRTGGLGKLVTFRGLTQLMQKFIFHDVYPCPVSKYVPKIEGIPKTKTYALDINKDPRSRDFVKKIKRIRNLLISAKAGLGDYVTAMKGGSVKTSTGGTQLLRVSTVVMGLKADLFTADKLVGKLMSGSTINVPGLEKDLARINSDLRAVARNIGRGSEKFQGYAIELNVGHLGSRERRQRARLALEDAIGACDSILGTHIKRNKTVTYDKLDRLSNQIMRPDVWFAAPPRCNVLFPEMYSGFSWSRNFLREVSRLELQTTNEILGPDALFNGRYYSPNVADMRKGLRLSSRKFGRLIMEHELLTGIIPMFEKLSEANIYSMKGRKVKHKGARVSYAQRAVNFQYFKHRFASRQMQCQGRFNPWFVPGFPGLIIDRPMDNDKLVIAGLPIAEQLSTLNIEPAKGTEITRGTVLREITPTQFLGSCVQLSHSLSQQGGTTSYGFAQARIHREGTEYLGVDKAEVSKKLGTARRGTLVAAVPGRAPKVDKRGPKGGTITGVVDVTRRYPDEFLPVYGASKGAAEVKVGTSELFIAGTEQQTSPDSYKAYRVIESFTRRARVIVDLPIEDAVRPPWIWDGYSNLQIGDTYMQFFGTNAITDIEGYTSDETLILLEGADTYTALQEAQEGITYGEQEANDKGYYTDQSSSTKEQNKPRKNKANKNGGQAAETGKKVRADAVLAMETDRTIESSTDYLVRVYSFIKHHGLDTGEFLRNYTWRPVATLPEILGSADFFIFKDKNGNYDSFGDEGFHSRAFGDVADLFGLVDPKVKKVLGLSEEKEPVAAMKLDMRKRKREAIWAYMQELTESRGLLG